MRPASAVPVHGECKGKPTHHRRAGNGPAKIATNFRSSRCIVLLSGLADSSLSSPCFAESIMKMKKGVAYTAAVMFLACGMAAAQSASANDSSQLTIPCGTKVPLALKQSVSTKNAREGDAVYAVTTFPVVINDRIVVPAGTYVQGRISNVKR